MKVALIGYGKMGRLLEKRLLEKEHEVLLVVDPKVQHFVKDKGLSVKGGAKHLDSGAAAYASLENALEGVDGEGLGDVDIVIEYTHPDSAAANLLFLTREKIPVVTGTTGWYDKLPEIEKNVNAAGTSLLWSSNFSLGVNLFYRIAAHAAKLIDPFAEYDAAGYEIHHNKKADSPSGTARVLAEQVLAQMTRKKKVLYDLLERPPAADELHFASLRVGSVPGTHSLIFDSAADSIEIKHTARSRDGFAAGTVLAAEWLIDKKRSGVFTIDDVLMELL